MFRRPSLQSMVRQFGPHIVDMALGSMHGPNAQQPVQPESTAAGVVRTPDYDYLQQLQRSAQQSPNYPGGGGGSPPNDPPGGTSFEPPDPPGDKGKYNWDAIKKILGSLSGGGQQKFDSQDMTRMIGSLGAMSFGAGAMTGGGKQHGLGLLPEGTGEFVGSMKGFSKTAAMGTASPLMWPKTAKEMAKLPAIVKDFAESLDEANKKLAAFSPSMGMVEAEDHRRSILRQLQSGEATAKSSASMNEAINDLKDELQPVKDGIRNVIQNILTPMLRAVEESVTFAKNAFKALSETNLIASKAYAIFERLSENDDDGRWDAYSQFLADLAKEEMEDPTGVVPRR